MDFFEKLGKKATETFNSAAEKTNKIASETKIKISVETTKKKTLFNAPAASWTFWKKLSNLFDSSRISS